jgi:hypothetical protein
MNFVVNRTISAAHRHVSLPCRGRGYERAAGVNFLKRGRCLKFTVKITHMKLSSIIASNRLIETCRTRGTTAERLLRDKETILL